MNVFVLNTGRCGSVTLSKACAHITNFSVGHESRTHLLGKERLNYPKNHIEIDNRLSWFLGRLDCTYGDAAIYVHLRRDIHETAQSYTKRYHYGIIKAYREEILLSLPPESDRQQVAVDYCNTVNNNIKMFLKNKTKKMDFHLENAEQDFINFCKLIGAQVNIKNALSEFKTRYNISPTSSPNKKPLFIRAAKKIQRIVVHFPDFIKKV